MLDYANIRWTLQKMTKGDCMEFGNKDIFARVKLNLSQTRLASLLQVSLTTINSWEMAKLSQQKKINYCLKSFAGKAK